MDGAVVSSTQSKLCEITIRAEALPPQIRDALKEAEAACRCRKRARVKEMRPAQKERLVP
jgi:hypothetical protein